VIVPARPFPSLAALAFRGGEVPREVEAGRFFRQGREALLYGLKRFGLRPGDALVLPAYYCESALAPLRHYGLRPVFVDVDCDLQVPLEAVYEALDSSRAGVVVLVEFFGFPTKCDRDFVARCHELGAKVVIDRCHAALSCREAICGADGTVSSFSKTLAVPDGGYWCSAEDSYMLRPRATGRELVYLMERFAEKGAVRLGWPNPYGVLAKRLRSSPSKVMVRGVGQALPVQPSLGLAQYLGNASFLEQISGERVKNYRRLSAALEGLGMRCLFPQLPAGVVPQVLTLVDGTGAITGFLRKRGIGAFQWPGDELPEEVASRPDLYPHANEFNRTATCLPVHQDITEGHIIYMVKTVAEWKKEAA
jgi:perosamine synthetase